MIFREAGKDDIKQIFVVRYAVKENMLFDSDLINERECESYLRVRGKGWVCEMDNQIAGFAIAELKDHNLWAMFILPA